MKKTLTDHLSKATSCKFLWVVFLIILFSPTIHSQPDVEWSKGYGGTLNDIPFAMQKTPDGGSIIAGQSASLDGEVSVNYGGYDVWVTKLDADGNLDWSKNYGGSKDDFAMDIQLTSDGGYVISGGSFSDDGDVGGNYGKGDIWILKINVNGLLEWSSYFGGAGADIATTIQQTIDGGYIVAGCTGSAGEPGLAAGAGGNDFWVLKLNPDGTLNWQKTYGGARHDAAQSIHQTMDGGFLIGGNTWSKDGDIIENNGQSDAWILKTDAAGVVEWSKTFGGITTDRLSDIVESPDGNFVLAGTFAAFDTTGFGFGGRYDENFWMLKFDPNGNELWSKNYGSSKYDEATCLRTTLDGGYLIGGYIQAGDEDGMDHFGHKDFWIIRTDSTGEMVWQKTLGGAQNEVVQAIEETIDGGFLLAGFSNSVFVDTLLEVLGYEDWWVVKLESTAITVDLGDDLTLCENETFMLDVENPNCVCNYLWNDGDTTSTRTFALLEDTQFSVTVTNALGFSLSDEILITISTPTAILEPTPISCNGNEDGMIDLIPDGNYTYLWNNNATTEDLNNLLTGTYTATMTDVFGCTFVQSTTVTEPPAISISQTVNHVDCFVNNDGSITTQISGGTGSYSFAWSNGETTPNLSNLSSGTYTLTITDFHLCQKIKEIAVSQNTGIEVVEQITENLCYGNTTGAIDLTVSGGTGNYTFLWNDGETTEDIDQLAAADYIVTISDGGGCEEIQLFTVGQPDSINITPTITDPTCFDSLDGKIELSVMGGTGNFTYEWNASGFIKTTSVPILDSIPAGIYNLFAEDENGCIDNIFNIEVTEPDPIQISNVQIQNTTCFSSGDGSIDVSVTGGSLPYIYQLIPPPWDPGLHAGDYHFEIMDGNGCQFTSPIYTVTNPPQLEVSTQMTHPTSGNNDGSMTALVSGGTPGYEFLWSDGQTTPQAINLAAGTYTMTITDQNGCQITTTILLETTAIFEIENLKVFEIYPNPNDGHFFITIEFQNLENAEILIMDELGQPIFEFRKQTVMILEEIKLPTIAAGIYFVRVKTEEGISVRKMIVME